MAEKKKTPKLNTPVKSDRAGKKYMVFVRDPKTDRVRKIHFGDSGYKNNYSKEAKANYLSRSAGIRDKSGKLTKDNKLSPNYWSRRYLWGKGTKVGTGPGKTK